MQARFHGVDPGRRGIAANVANTYKVSTKSGAQIAENMSRDKTAYNHHRDIG